MAQKVEDYKKTVGILMTEAKNIIDRDSLIVLNSVSFASIHNDTE